MATDGASSQPRPVPLDSHDTALCIIPPKRFWPLFDSLRSLYDKAYEKWPPHINLVYPYVRVDDLPKASGLVAAQMNTISDNAASPLDSLQIRLNAADVFSHRHDNTIFVYDDDTERVAKLQQLRQIVLKALDHISTTTRTITDYRMHMTVGQSQDLEASSHDFLLKKASLLPTVEWNVDKLSILVRERMEIDGNSFSQMKVWGTIDLTTFSICRAGHLEHFDQSKLLIDTMDAVPETSVEGNPLVNYPYTFSEEQGRWVSYRPSATQIHEQSKPGSLAIASYNVLAEFEYPPSAVRYPLIVQNVLQQAILADILVLQEVTDDFLSFVCQDNDVRQHYRFISNGPSSQGDIGPLPSHLNVVVLSKWPFSWSWLPFSRRHKGSMIVKFTDIGRREGDVFIPTILSTVHLTCGLTDGSVSAKKLELQALIAHLSENYPRSSWIVAGDFNITTSAYTIEAAFKKKVISSQTVAYLKGLEKMLTESELIDAWTFARVRYGDLTSFESDFERQAETFEGEQGATFDPTVNDLAAEVVGNGFNNRPQRYDRILLKGDDLLVTGFTMFGRRQSYLHENGSSDAEAVSKRKLSYASDHWGIRCSVQINRPGDGNTTEDAAKLSVPVHLTPAPSSLSVSGIKSCLDELGIFPSQEDAAKRKEALDLLKAVVLEEDAHMARGTPAFVLVPVGSYGLGVWTSSSDIDCLCIGAISARVFFTLASQRIRRAEDRGVKLRRRVNAHSGTMLELEVLGIKMDLQYCPSTIIAETWPNAVGLPATDPIFALPSQTLAKLKPVRDMHYIQRTIPDYAAFRTAYYLIKHWAKQRGIYSAKFGFLSGIQISVLLSRVCKLLSHEGMPVPLPSILTTFFRHYSEFDWSTQVAFDPFFHKQLRYVRSTREPIAVLGFHPPTLNTALNASLPSVRTISNEFKRADTLLSKEGMTWTTFLSAAEGSVEFLAAFKTFIKIDAQFWGVSLAKGSSFVGWLESRCVMLLVDLNRRIPTIHARIWPARFVNEGTSEDETDYQGYYLIGLDRCEGLNEEHMSKDDMKAALGSLHAALHKFEGQIRGDEKYFDPNTSWMSASLINQSELGALLLDNREWGEYTIGDDDFEEDEEDEEEEDEELFGSGDENDNGKGLAGKSKSKNRVTPSDRPPRPAYSGKFRSSADVINRIRWDPNMDSGDYIVGYEDRFLGPKERALDAWKSEQTDEEFIPQHRILYFKRKSDGVVVWDRKERRDTIFGSGINSIEVGVKR